MKNIKSYAKYKASGIAWLGDIPEHWEVRKLRFVSKIKTGRTPKIESSSLDYFSEGSINWFTPSDFKNPNGYLVNSKRKVNEFAIQNSQVDLYPENTVFLIGIGATIGKIGICQLKSSANQQLNAIVFKESINPKFGYYSLLIGNIQIKFLADFTTLPILNQSKTKEIFILYPPLEEQQAIANFLDYKTTKIDRFIAKKKQLIKLLNEQKSAIINDAVTKGLNPNVKMKPSGIEWLGDIPEHWEVRKLKYVVSKIGDIDHYMPPTIENGIPYVMTGNLGDFVSNIDFQSCKKVSQLDYDNLSKKIKSAKGDVILARYATIGTVAYIDIDLEFLVSYSCVTIKPNPSKLLGLYLFYYFKTNVFTLEIRNQVNVNTQGNVGIRDLKEVRIILPPYHEQINLVEFIEKETAKLNQVIATIEKEITLVQEYRTALIAEAVTGKIDVRDYELGEINDELEELDSLESEEYQEIENEVL